MNLRKDMLLHKWFSHDRKSTEASLWKRKKKKGLWQPCYTHLGSRARGCRSHTERMPGRQCTDVKGKTHSPLAKEAVTFSGRLAGSPVYIELPCLHRALDVPSIGGSLRNTRGLQMSSGSLLSGIDQSKPPELHTLRNPPRKSSPRRRTNTHFWVSYLCGNKILLQMFYLHRFDLRIFALIRLTLGLWLTRDSYPIRFMLRAQGFTATVKLGAHEGAVRAGNDTQYTLHTGGKSTGQPLLPALSRETSTERSHNASIKNYY